MNIFLFRGLPGSGKSSVGNIFAQAGNTVAVATDEYFIDEQGNYNFDATKLREAHEWCLNRVRTLVVDFNHLDPINVCVCNTFTAEWEMKPYFDLAKEFNVNIFSLIVENRHGNGNVHSVPDETIERMKNRFDIKL
jgi:hypothetical protein